MLENIPSPSHCQLVAKNSAMQIPRIDFVRIAMVAAYLEVRVAIGSEVRSIFAI